MLAKPQDNILYSVEKGRLSAHVLHQLKLIEKNPTKDKLKEFETVLEVLIGNSLSRVAHSSYLKAANDVGRAPDAVRAIILKRDMQARAKQASVWISDTTGAALDILAGMSKSHALSTRRADLIAVDNLAVAFFRGTRFGWGLDSSSRKLWQVSDAHDNDDLCDDNEDEGPLLIDEPFQSGDFEPPAHVACNCNMKLIRSRL